MLKKIKEIAGENPVFLMGDFNATPSDEPIRIIAETLFDTFSLSQTPHFGPESTFNGFKAKEQDNRKIDHIFVNNKNIKVLKHATLSNTWAGLFASDHHPVMTSVVIK